jgi:sugar O-acyltransferase (sialic acid O-acetyltransferase NeuD family)
MILAIYCCGGFGKEILILAKEINQVYHRWNKMIFVDDNFNKKQFKGLTVLDFQSMQEEYSSDECEFTIASGEPYLRKILSEKVEDAAYKLCTLIHPDIRIADDTVIENGCIICKGTVITDDVYIGKSTMVNLLCSIGHDVNIGNYCAIQPHCSISGNVHIGDSTHIGTYSAIRDEVTIGPNCIIGMGSIVTKNIKANSIAYGSPAKIIRANNKKLVF